MGAPFVFRRCSWLDLGVGVGLLAGVLLFKLLLQLFALLLRGLLRASGAFSFKLLLGAEELDDSHLGSVALADAGANDAAGSHRGGWRSAARPW